MNATFTQEILVNYLYGQLTESEMEAMIALENDEKLMPSETSINIIMDYSKRTSKENQVVAF